MQTSEFYELVQERSQLDMDDRAEAATKAVLETLGETVTSGEAEDVATQLPTDLAGALEDADHDGAGYEREEFVDRVGNRLRETDVDPDEAERITDAVADALAETVSRGELEDLTSQLEGSIDPLFGGAGGER